MNKRRVPTKGRKKERFGEQSFSFPFGAMINFLCVILLIIQRIMIANRIYDEANGYLNLTIFMLLVIAMITVFPLKNAEIKMIRSRIQKEQIKNIGKVLNVSILISGVINALISVGLYLFANRLSNLFFGNDYCAMCIQFMAFFLLISGVASALMGYFDGNYKKEKILFIRIVYVLFLILFMILFSDGMLKYGSNVAMFLHSDQFKDSYAASGAAFGIVLASFIDLVCLFICFLLMRNSLRYEMDRDKTKKGEKNQEVAKLLLSTSLSDVVKNLLFILPVFLDVLFMAIASQNNGNDHFVEQIGILFGKYGTFLLLPLSVSFIASEKIREYLWNAYHEKDIVKVRAICAGEMKLQAGIMAFFISLFLCMAKPLCQMIFHYGDVDVTAGLMMKSVALIFFYPLAITAYRLLLGIRRNSQAYLCLGVSFAVHTVCAVICEFALHLEAFGIIVSMTVFAVCLLFMSLSFLTKFIRYHQEWIRSLLIPTVLSIVIGLLGRGIYQIFDSPLGVHFSVILSVIFIFFIYGYFFFKVFRVKKKELQYLPGGNLLLSITEFLRM